MFYDTLQNPYTEMQMQHEITPIVLINAFDAICARLVRQKLYFGAVCLFECLEQLPWVEPPPPTLRVALGQALGHSLGGCMKASWPSAILILVWLGASHWVSFICISDYICVFIGDLTATCGHRRILSLSANACIPCVWVMAFVACDSFHMLRRKC